MSGLRRIIREVIATEVDLANAGMDPAARRAWSNLERAQLSVGSISSYLGMQGKEDESARAMEVYHEIKKLMDEVESLAPGSDLGVPAERDQR